MREKQFIEQIVFRVSPKQREVIEREAAARRRSVSDTVRLLLETALTGRERGGAPAQAA
jgi:uncharacterized protein (DUF1778 family)